MRLAPRPDPVTLRRPGRRGDQASNSGPPTAWVIAERPGRADPPNSCLAPDRLAAPDLIGHRPLDRQPFHRRGAVEAVTDLACPDDEVGVVWLGDRTAMGEHEDVRPQTKRRAGPCVDQRRA